MVSSQTTQLNSEHYPRVTDGDKDKILEELTGSENIFSQTQPGFLEGNITNITNPNEKTIRFC